jgi:hypothetical protein
MTDLHIVYFMACTKGQQITIYCISLEQYSICICMEPRGYIFVHMYKLYSQVWSTSVEINGKIISFHEFTNIFNTDFKK